MTHWKGTTLQYRVCKDKLGGTGCYIRQSDYLLSTRITCASFEVYLLDLGGLTQ